MLIGSVAFAAIETAKVAWFQAHGIGVLTLAIVLGMAAGNSVYPRIAAASACGVIFSKQRLLRAGIVLYGLKLTFQDIAAVGVPGVAIDALLLLSTFALSCWAGTRLFKLNRRCAMLIGAGSSICGAAAVMAAEPVIGGRSEQVTTAVSTVVLFGTLAMLRIRREYGRDHENGARDAARAVPDRALGLFIAPLKKLARRG